MNSDEFNNGSTPNDPKDQAGRGLAPTAAVGSQSPILGRHQAITRAEPTFSIDQVMSLVTTITQQAASSAVTAALSAASLPQPPRERGNFYLPPFDPDVRSHDIRDWCANVDETISVFAISPQEARMKAILQLKGRAKVWADTWSLHSTTWEQVKDDLIKTFSKEFRYADDVQRWRSYTSEQATSYAEYATTAWTLFKRVRPEASDGDIIDAVMSVVELHEPWHSALQDLQLAINCTMSKSTGKSPMELLLGKKCSPPAIKLLQVDDDEPIEDIVSVRNASKQRMDERSFQDKLRFDIGKAQIKPFKVGDFVLMRRNERLTTKLGAKFEGPMEILEILPNDRYKVKHVNLRGSSEKIASHDFLRPAPVGQFDPFHEYDDESAVWAEGRGEIDLTLEKVNSKIKFDDASDYDFTSPEVTESPKIEEYPSGNERFMNQGYDPFNILSITKEGSGAPFNDNVVFKEQSFVNDVGENDLALQDDNNADAFAERDL
ncbi:uncharacterized protein [Choristoneura fumiferana]|uniref:uncharacterized protein n=1 Tax=Choristoneura fumiferana TaxID=7141 RepID=UPI003D157178